MEVHCAGILQAMLFPPKLYDYCHQTLGKNIIVILNKIDIVPAPLVVAWQDYFKKRFPGLEVLCFTSYEGRGAEISTEAGMKVRKSFSKGSPPVTNTNF